MKVYSRYMDVRERVTIDRMKESTIPDVIIAKAHMIQNLS